MENTQSPPAHRPAQQAEPHDFPGRIEARGIDWIPPAERHGHPRELFWVWLAANITYLYFVLGGTMILLGLSVWQSLAVVVAGNLLWLGVGALAVTGPTSGTPGVVVSRSMFGIRGNRVLSAGTGWAIGVAYEAVNLALGSLAGFALADQLGLSVGWPVKAVILALIAAVTFTVSVYGHATIVRLSTWFSALLGLVMAVAGAFVIAHVRTGYRPVPPLHGTHLLSTALIGFTIIASNPLSWGTGADYARYLPATVSKPRVMLFTAAGGFVPAVVLAGLGVLAGTRIDMNDPQTSIAQIVPGWFYPLFLGVVVIGSVTNNILTTYSSGLCLQALGIRASRSRTVLIDAAVGGGVAVYALFASHFLDTLNSILQFTVAFLGPSMAVYITDIMLRRNRYDGLELHDETPAGRHWYRRGVNPAGAAALIAGTAVAALCVNTTAWTAPVAHALDGADLSSITGPVTACLVYLALWRYRHPRSQQPTTQDPR
ncbi:purine-cytosine permease family protein [Streptacidiphilus rugosus]|uniref:purine-cytosine permease family protein n=1 Tax=Streptacidiphilus rugosus TaxID=405783 RepID=UPI00068CF937|nr:cytosine permease [Streptacidiphilus rugosus]